MMKSPLKKIGKFFFFCLDARDKKNLSALGSTSFQGALFLFTHSSARASFQPYKALVWTKIEGLPLLYNKFHIARQTLQRIETCPIL